MDYRTYRLRILDTGYLTSSQHYKLIGTSKQVEGVPSAEKSAGRNYFLVLNFLYSFKSACRDCNVSKDQAVRLLKQFLEGSLQSTFSSFLSTMSMGSAEGSIASSVTWMEYTGCSSTTGPKRYC